MKKERRKLRSAQLRKTASVLAVVGGGTSAVSGGLVWVPYMIAHTSRGVFPPLLGFIGFVLGMLIILGGILIVKGRGFLGGNLAIWCGIASLFGYDGFALLQAFYLLLGETGFVAGYLLTLIVSVGFPVLGGIFALVSWEQRLE